VDLAIWHENHTVLDSSIANLKKAIAVYKKQGLEKELAETYLLLKANYGSTAAYDKASEAVYAALDLYEKIKDRKGIAKCYTSIGDLFYYSNRYSEGAEYCKKAIAIQKENGFEEDLALSYRRLAENQLFLSS
ncbi:MAG TPA: histidine kinase, partial [Flavobacteriaceae bacterium]|nr:histidine kinase [Flavobacteriaceae bacterium]